MPYTFITVHVLVQKHRLRSPVRRIMYTNSSSIKNGAAEKNLNEIGAFCEQAGKPVLNCLVSFSATTITYHQRAVCWTKVCFFGGFDYGLSLSPPFYIQSSFGATIPSQMITSRRCIVHQKSLSVFGCNNLTMDNTMLNVMLR